MQPDHRTVNVFCLVLGLCFENRLLAHDACLAAAVPDPENLRLVEWEQTSVEHGAHHLRRWRHDIGHVFIAAGRSDAWEPLK
jgi:hypothetical protein